jgi:hypothetical protein
MPTLLDDIKVYLPKYLSEEATVSLFRELASFPNNIDSRMYTIKLKDEQAIFQGDGLSELWVCDLPSESRKRTRVMVLSNTCDTAPDNKRLLGPRLLYCPIIRLAQYESLLRTAVMSTAEEHLKALRRQEVTSMMYLPENEKLGGEAVALLDRVNNCDSQNLDLGELTRTRLFTLGDYGFYLFLLKISIHFTRIREGVARS